ncbi:DUF739 family protein [Clostridium aminobutyricum]|nr:DUF739 family protein [Clostridium aminobutyricum]
MIVDVKKLKEKIVQSNYTNDSFAKEIGMDQSTLYRKLKANGDTFMVREVYTIIEVLQLDQSEVGKIFFSENSHLRENQKGLNQ